MKNMAHERRRPRRVVVSVMDYMTQEQRADVISGAGLVDCTDAIQWAINACGGVYLPKGAYRLHL